MITFYCWKLWTETQTTFSMENHFWKELFTLTLNSPTISYTEHWTNVFPFFFEEKKQIIIQLNGFYNCAEHGALNVHYFFFFSFFFLNNKTSFFACDTSESVEHINSHLIHRRQTQPPTQTHSFHSIKRIERKSPHKQNLNQLSKSSCASSNRGMHFSAWFRWSLF